MNQHLTPDVLARLADQDWSHLTPAERRHLAVCQECRDAVVEAAGVAHEYQRAVAPLPPPDLSATILARTTGRRHRRRRRGWALAAAAVPIAAALVLVLTTNLPGNRPSAVLIGPIQIALADRALESMQFPDLAASSAEVAFRGEAGRPSPVRSAIQDLAAAYRDDPDQARVAQWLVGGYLALDDLPTARLYADDALRHRPRDGRLLAAAGIVAFRQGQYARSDSLLMAALKAGHDGDDVRFNLAVLKLEQGRRRDAVTILRQLADSGDGDLAARAESLLQRITESG